MLSKTEEGYLFEEFIYCQCGCGKTRSKISKHDNKTIARVIPYHTKGLVNLGSKNNMWRGDKVSIKVSLHAWVRRHLRKPDKCEYCNIDPPYDLANVTGIYNRDFSNWKYLCRRCHMISDGRMEKLIVRMTDRKKHAVKT